MVCVTGGIYMLIGPFPPSSIIYHYSVIAVMCPEQSGEILKNRFGMAFRSAADQMNVPFRHDRFNTAVIEVDKENCQRFIETLHYTMDVR